MDDKNLGEEKTIPPESGGQKGYDLAAGEVLGDYEIVKPLGRGGMGQVYLAENRVNGRKVALKILPTEAMGAGFVERFRMESRVMSELEHPGIVRVHHAGVERGRYYLTMDYVAGPEGEALTLEDLREAPWSAEPSGSALGPGAGKAGKGGEGERSEGREQGERRTSNVEHRRLHEEQIREIALQICDALAYAHGKGIVHRDLKPANILLEVQGSGFKVQGSGEKTGAPISASAGHKGSSLPSNLHPLPSPKIRITDFGLAKVVGDEFVSEVIKKSVSLSMGRSIGEMPTVPGSKRAAYEGTSTGAILGTYAYMSPEQKAGAEVTAQSDLYSFGVILYWMLTGRKPEGRAKPVSHYGVSTEWDAIVDKCLEVDFQDRYGDVGEVAGDLRGMGQGAGGKGKKMQGAGSMGQGAGGKGKKRQGAGGMGQGKKKGTTDGHGWTRMGWGLVVGCLVLGVVWWGIDVDRGDGSRPVDGRNWISPASGMEFLWIQELGIWVGKHEVTNAEYRRKVVGHHSGEFRGHSLNGDRQPVVQVSFDDARAYAAWMTERDRASGLLPDGFSYRLPTEQEWETFAKAGRNVIYPWGKNWPPTSGEAGNYADETARSVLNDVGIQGYEDGHAVSAPVHEIWGNPWGLFGVGGNVWEMSTRDGIHQGAQLGGSWALLAEQTLFESLITVSGGMARLENVRDHDLGFRLVLSR